MLGVKKAEPLDGHRLRLEFTDGAIGDVDCSFLLESGLGAELRDLSYFRQVTVDPDLRTVVWPNGLDPAPDLLYRRLSTTTAEVSSAA